MSSKIKLKNPQNEDMTKEVNNAVFLSQHFGALYLNDQYSDLTLIVQGQKIHTHRLILATRSEYFRGLLYGGFKESKSNSIELSLDTPLDPFLHVLSYIYTGRMGFSHKTQDQILQILELSQKYVLFELVEPISEHFIASLSIENVCKFYEVASIYQIQNLKNSCLSFLDKHAPAIVDAEKLRHLSAQDFHDVVVRSTFSLEEKRILSAALDWYNSNPKATEKDGSLVFTAVRFHLIPLPDLNELVLSFHPMDSQTIHILILSAMRLQKESELLYERQPWQFINNDLAIAGDLLVITKPLGTKLAENFNEWLDEPESYGNVELAFSVDDAKNCGRIALHYMTKPKGNDIKLMDTCNVHGATEITSSGFHKHLEDLASIQKNEVSFVIYNLPLISDTLSIAYASRCTLESLLAQSADHYGGLLLCMPKEDAAIYCTHFENLEGYRPWIVGIVQNGQRGAIIKDKPRVIEVSDIIQSSGVMGVEVDLSDFQVLT